MPAPAQQSLTIAPVDLTVAPMLAGAGAEGEGDGESTRDDAPEATAEELESIARGERELGDDPVIIAGRYRVEGLLGRGGMASVYAAEDLTLARPVAVKVLSSTRATERLIARLLREARFTAGLRHPNVVEVLDFGTTKTGLTYLAMERLEGEDLRDTLAREGRLSWPRVRALMLEICAGLEAAHAAGIVHRDLKPSNCYRVEVEGRETVRLLDFGVATRLEEREEAEERLTLNEHIVGTPKYMAPEQARGEDLDERCDVYALGLLLGELLTGSLPYSADTPSAMLAAHIYTPAASLSEMAPRGLAIPAGLEAVQARALSKDRKDRYPDVASFAAALRELDEQVSTPRRILAALTRRPWLSHAAAAVLAFGMGALGLAELHPAVGIDDPNPSDAAAVVDASAELDAGAEQTPLPVVAPLQTHAVFVPVAVAGPPESESIDAGPRPALDRHAAPAELAPRPSVLIEEVDASASLLRPEPADEPAPLLTGPEHDEPALLAREPTALAELSPSGLLLPAS